MVLLVSITDLKLLEHSSSGKLFAFHSPKVEKAISDRVVLHLCLGVQENTGDIRNEPEQFLITIKHIGMKSLCQF